MKFPQVAVFGVLILVVAAGIGAVVWFNQEPTQPTPIPSPTPTPSLTPTPSPIPIVEIPADWKTYRNEEFGFEVRYPADWKFEQDDNKRYDPRGGSALLRFRLYDFEEDAQQKELHKKCSENLKLDECAGSSLAWWTTGIHIFLIGNSQRSDISIIANKWQETGSYLLRYGIDELGSIEVVRGIAMTKFGQDVFLFLNPSKSTLFLVEDIPSHSNVTEQILSSFRFANY